MSPWEVIGWILVALLIVVMVAVIVILVLICISISLFLRDKKREISAKEEADKRLFDGAPVPYFKNLESGDVFKVSYQAWEVMTLETEYLPERKEQRLRVTARTITDQL